MANYNNRIGNSDVIQICCVFNTLLAIVRPIFQSDLGGSKNIFFSWGHPQQKVGISQEFAGVGCLYIFLVKDKTPQQEERTAPAPPP